jgi:hypothetical protein
MNKSLAILFTVYLLCFQNCHAAQPVQGPLDKIDGRFVYKSLGIKTIVGIKEDDARPENMPDCAQVKTFQVFEAGAPGQIVIALCGQGEYGPGTIESTFARQVEQAKNTIKRFPAPGGQVLLAGAEPVAIPLEDRRHGQVSTLPYVGHGVVLVTLGYAVTAGNDATLVVQAALNPNDPRNLNEPVAALLKAIYERLQQDKG